MNVWSTGWINWIWAHLVNLVHTQAVKINKNNWYYEIESKYYTQACSGSHIIAYWIMYISNNILWILTQSASIDLMVFTGHSHIANWRPGPLESMGHNWEPIRAFAEMQYQLHLKIEITETLISSKKQKKMHIPYGELPLEEIKLIESIKKVIHIMGESIQLVCMQII